MAITAADIVNALLAWASDKICATELSFSEHGTRADFWTVETIRSKSFRTTAYEIKVSRQDFKNDTNEKQAAALLYSDRFFYVTPPELISKNEVPEWAGLIEWDGTIFSVKKKPPKREKQEPTWQLVIDILRSSTRCRRDTNLFTSEIAMLRNFIRMKDKQLEVSESYSRDKWMRRMNRTNTGSDK
jgi:hypothetical protein